MKKSILGLSGIAVIFMWAFGSMTISFFFEAKEIYNNDTVELFFNPSNKKEGKYLQGDKQVFFDFNKGKAGAYLNTGFDCKYAWKDMEDGYSVEIAIPWDTLGLKPAEGLKIEFDLQNDDQDITGIRQSIIEWSGTGDNWRDTGKFGTLILRLKKMYHMRICL